MNEPLRGRNNFPLEHWYIYNPAIRRLKNNCGTFQYLIVLKEDRMQYHREISKITKKRI